VPKGLEFRTVISAHAARRPDSLRGHSFSVEELILIRDWARRNDHEAMVCLDHGVPGEEYEEAVMLRFGTGRRCRFILWRSSAAVVVQPLIGRCQEYPTVQEALAGALLNRALRQFG
jgi:hypothetical protein